MSEEKKKKLINELNPSEAEHTVNLCLITNFAKKTMMHDEAMRLAIVRTSRLREMVI
jgi:hypothetical protein